MLRRAYLLPSALLGLAVLGLVACPADRPAESPDAPAPESEAAPSAAESEPDPLMTAHFRKSIEMREAVIGGDLEAAKAAAAGLVAELGAGTGEQRVAQAAQSVADAADLGAAARGVAQAATACGACHQSKSLELTFPDLPDPSEAGDDPAMHMQRHQWAAEQLWRGLVGNYETAWGQGGAGFAESPLHQGELDEASAASVDESVQTMAGKVHELGAKARDATDPDQRADIFGELLTTCAGCHTSVRG